MIDYSKLKDDKQRLRTQSLFYELNGIKDAIFTLKEDDYEAHGKKLVSLKKLYLEIADPTEYEFAKTVFGSWKHWQRLCANAIIRPYIDEWREELEIKIRSQAIKSILQTARDEGSKGTQAAKWLAEGKWQGTGRGRPSKEEVERTKRIHAGIKDEIDEDFERLGVH